MVSEQSGANCGTLMSCGWSLSTKNKKATPHGIREGASSCGCRDHVRGGWLGDHMPEYVLYIAYGLLVVGVAACLAFVARNFEDEDLPEPHSKQPVRSHNPRGW